MRRFFKKLATCLGLHFQDDKILTAVVQNFYTGEHLPPWEAQRLVEDGVVELLRNGRHASNGLLVTTNGYFLTAHHCIRNKKEKELVVRTALNGFYPVSHVCETSSRLDLALVKANIPVEPRPMVYKFFQEERFSVFHPRPVVGLVRHEGVIQLRGGFIKGQFDKCITYSDGHRYEKLARCDMATYFGDSGAVVVTPQGAIVGILSGGANPYMSSIASWYEALRLVTKYAHR